MRKVVRPAIGLASSFLDVVHASGTRTFPQPRSQAKQLLARSHGQDFDAAIGVIAHPSGDAEDMRLALHEPAKADALHSSADKEAAGLCSFLSAEVISDTARPRPHSRLTLVTRYAPSAVSTRIFSPSLMNGGTCTTSPVSVLAGLVTLEAVALFNPGSVSTTVELDGLRQLDAHRLAVEEFDFDLQIGDQVVDRVAQNVAASGAVCS